MAYKINGTTVVDNSRNVCACCVTSCCITASTRMDAPSGTTAQRPSSPATGSIYFDTDLGSLVSYDGAAWAAVGGSAGVPNALNSSTDEPWGFINWTTCNHYLRQCSYCPHSCNAEVPFLNPNQPFQCCCCLSANYTGNAIYGIANVNSTEINNAGFGLLICGNVLEQGTTGYMARTKFYSGSKILENVQGCHCCAFSWVGMHVWCDGSVSFKDNPRCSKKIAHNSFCGVCKCLVQNPRTLNISSTGGVVLQTLPTYQTIFCACSTAGIPTWSKDDFYFRSHINQSIKGVSPFSPFKLCFYGYCDACFFNVEAQFSICPETYLTQNEQVFDFAFEHHYCNGALRAQHPFSRVTAGTSCIRWRPGSNSMVSCDTTKFHDFSNLYFVSRRTDLWGGGLPRFPDHYVDQVYCCVGGNSCIDCSASGISRKTISFTCCPMFIAKRCSYAYCHIGATLICDQIEKPEQNTFYSKDGCTIFHFACANSCTPLCSCNFQSSGCCFGVSKALILNAIDRVNATKCTRIMVTPTCMHPAGCTAGCTYGTNNMPCLRNTCFYLICFTAAEPTANKVRNSKDEYHVCRYLTNVLPFGSGCWSYNSNKYYMISNRCLEQNVRPGCDGQVMVFDADNCSIACGLNFGTLIGQSNINAALKGSIFKLFSTPPVCMGSFFPCAIDLCRLIGGTITGDWCSYVCGITGDANESLLSHCLGYHLGPQKGTTFNCTCCGYITQIGACSDMARSHTWINPETDHLVMLRGISNCMQYCCGSSTASPCSISWIGFICYDLTNCCVSEVATIWPGRTEATKKWFDYAHTAAGCDCYYFNYNQFRMGACPCCAGVERSALANIVPYGDYTSYLASGCTDKGGVIINLQGRAWSPSLKAGCDISHCHSCYFGRCGTASGLLRCGTPCAIALDMGNSVYRIPHTKSMTCFFQSDPFLAEVFTYVFNPLEHFNLTSPSAACLCCYAKSKLGEEVITTLPPLCGCTTATNCPYGSVIPCASRLLELYTDQCLFCQCGTFGVCAQKVCDFVCNNFNHCLRGAVHTCLWPAMISGINGKHLGNDDPSNMNFDKFRIVSNNYSYIGDPRNETQLDGKTTWALKPGEDMFCRTIRWYTCLTCCSC